MTSRLIMVFGVLGLLIHGCSLIDSPAIENGTVSLTLVRGGEDDGARVGDKILDPLQRAVAMADSIVVCAYPPGTGTTPEVCKGVAFPLGTNTVDVSLSVRAENNKRVSVRVYAGRTLEFFGIDEDVDVVADQNTRVQIQAVDFVMGTISVQPKSNPPSLWDDEPFILSWNGVAGASAYHVQVSLDADFSSPVDLFVADTVHVDSLQAGNYYVRIAALNPYAKSEWQSAQIHVGGAPQISGFAPEEMPRDFENTFEVFGSDLHHFSTSVWLFGQECEVVTRTPTRLLCRVTPAINAFSDVITVSSRIGNDQSANPMKIQAIAYIMGDVTSGDLETATTFKAMIDSYGDPTLNSTVLIVPYTLIGSVLATMDMFDLIVVGHDTGTDAFNWGGGGALAAARADIVRTSGAAVLGLGRGGASYFEAISLNIGIGSCVLDTSGEIYVVDRSAKIYREPIDVEKLIPGNGMLEVYGATAAPLRLGVDKPVNGVGLYGSWGASSTAYAFVDQPASGGGVLTHNNFLWGFEGDPGDLTLIGHSLFTNVIVFLFDDGTKDVVVP